MLTVRPRRRNDANCAPRSRGPGIPPTTSSAAASRGPNTTAMPPAFSVVLLKRLRWKITRIASESDRTPAASAAATSPTLWPIVNAGRTPTLASARTLAAWMAKIIGWATSVRARSVATSADVQFLDQRPTGKRKEVRIDFRRARREKPRSRGRRPGPCPTIASRCRKKRTRSSRRRRPRSPGLQLASASPVRANRAKAGASAAVSARAAPAARACVRAGGRWPRRCGALAGAGAVESRRHSRPRAPAARPRSARKSSAGEARGRRRAGGGAVGDDDMGAGAAESERTDAGDSGAVGARGQRESPRLRR